MHFLYPSVLWFLTILIIPVLIHLFNFRKVKRVYFTNTSFITDLQKKTSTRSQLKRLLILFSRLGFILFLVFAFAGLTFTEFNDSIAGDYTTIYLDNSLSMSGVDRGGITKLEEGLNITENLLNYKDENQSYYLLTNDFIYTSNRVLRKNEVLDRINEVQFTPSSRSIADVITRGSENQSKELILISDFQSLTSSDIKRIAADSSKIITLFRVSDDRMENLYVDSVFLNPDNNNLSTNRLSIILANVGSTDRKEVLITLFNNQGQLSTFTTTVPASSQKLVDMDLGLMENLAGQYRVEIADNELTFDNTFYFTINRPKRINIYMIYAEGGSEYIYSVFQNEKLFNLSSDHIENVSYQKINTADLLILSKLKTIPSFLDLTRIPSARILIFPPEEIDMDSYSQFTGLSISLSKDSSRVSLNVSDLKDPFFGSIFERVNDQIDMPSTTTRFKVSGYHRPILSDRSGTPFMLQAGNASIYFVATPLLDRFTNFHKHALFLPVMYKLASRDQLWYEPQFFRMNNGIVHVETDSADQQLVEITSEYGNYIPSVNLRSGGMTLDLSGSVLEAGIYYVTQETDTLASLAFNFTKDESEAYDLDISLEEVDHLYDHVKVFTVDDLTDVQQSVAGLGGDRGLWKYALFLALIFLVAEILLLRFLS